MKAPEKCLTCRGSGKVNNSGIRSMQQSLPYLEPCPDCKISTKGETMKVRFIFYKAKFEWRNFLKTRRIRLVDDLISWWTWPWNIGTGPYAHCEVWTPDGDGDFEFTLTGKKNSDNTKIELGHGVFGDCYTSTLRDKEKGTCKRPASQVLKHLERWDYVEIDIPEDLFFAGKLWMNCQVRDNKGYGFKDIGKFFGLGFMADKHKNICSEFVFNYCTITGISKLPFGVVSPRRLSRMFTKAGYKMQRLK